MQLVYEQIEMAGATDVTVIIQGASGTGKELVAAAIHHASARSEKPLVRINCAALAETLLESELFGHVKGAFSGAYRDRQGTFEAAHGGTLLLDEIGEISPAVQVRLLRVLQEKVVTRVGDSSEIGVDVRIIAATNKNLRQLVAQGRFREDLFYRLNVFPIHTPPLAQRKSDIAQLCAHFVRLHRDRQGSPIHAISADAMRLLMEYCWPGNVRELENAIAYAFVVCKGEQIQLTDLPHELRVKALREGICAENMVGIAPVKPLERLGATPQKLNGRLPISATQLSEALMRNGGSRTATAAQLGISTVALWRKMKSLGIS
jgi:transcriptional regulator with PAS, ATPase and Fis domain